VVVGVLAALRRELLAYLVERSVERPDAALVPALDVARQLHARGHAAVKAAVFPEEADVTWRARHAAERARLQTDATGTEKERYDRRRMRPVDAPAYATRTLLFELMTDVHSTTKRFATELLFALCENDAAEFSLRCGLGNAIAFLQTRHLMP